MAIAIALLFGCGGSAAPTPTLAARSEAPEPRVEPATTGTTAPASDAPASDAPSSLAPSASAAEAARWPSAPTLAEVGGGCTAEPPIAIAADAASVALTGTPAGALLAYQPAGAHAVTLQPLDADGAAAGEPTVVEGASRMIGVSRVGDGLVLVDVAPIAGQWRHVLLRATPLDPRGHALGPAASHEISHDVDGGTLQPSATGGATWFVTTFDTSHEGRGVLAARIGPGADGTLAVGAIHRFADGLPDGSDLTGYRVDATDDELVALFGAHCEGCAGEDFDRPASVRYLGRYGGEQTVTVGDVGDVVHDLVLVGSDAHVLFARGSDYFTATIDDAGHVDAATPLDRSAPFPSPFGGRVLLEMAGRLGHEQPVLHDASGRRLGDPLPGAAIAWTGQRLLVASGDGAVRITPLACRASGTL